MARPRKIKSPEDFGKEFEKLKKPKELSSLDELQKCAVKYEKYPLENLQKLEKKLRDCTTEHPTVITYSFTEDKTVLYVEFLNHIKVVADIYCASRSFCMESNKPYLATAQKMLEVLKEWRRE